jgi:predicted CoA-binding protein
MIVAVLGASPKPERISNQALHRLQAKGHKVIPVNPAHQMIDGIPVVKRLSEIGEAVDTLTIYVGADHIGAIIPDIIKLRPNRVIINPGAESVELTTALALAKIHYLEACTLVMLSTGQF